MLLNTNWFLLLYIIPAIVTYLGWRWNYKVFARHEVPGVFDLVTIFVPVLNVVVGIVFLINWIVFYLGNVSFDLSFKRKKKKFDFNKFYKL